LGAGGSIGWKGKNEWSMGSFMESGGFGFDSSHRWRRMGRRISRKTRAALWAARYCATRCFKPAGGCPGRVAAWF
jgi:hypothetical protein